ncbi:hypothetical protein DPSP01_012446 [Paraphaeosphaeria sporulosa]|uniref:SMP domain-containing protein n=1 Tax=Paraphaeosphaeria sporulosa TaxID=1460663 RepID=A0A177CI75_9PLEO|nr:uncharacterized protein CC84DRAFT_785711 [Paraphaeosphaeria sporulosa]OAG06530.1 hypothetical protein CC84DRAFT_785711 [Paraphaeosphaeria sporulosa]
MATSIFRATRLSNASRSAAPISFRIYDNRTFVSTARTMAATVDSDFISRITISEKELTNHDEPVPGGPTAQAQKHANQPLTRDVVHDITMGERKITQREGPVSRGPTSIAQSILSATGGTRNNNASPSSNASNATGATTSNSASGSTRGNHGPGILDSETISKITEKEKQITGQDDPVRRGPTAQAQKHFGEPITSEALHDITEGEKNITGGERVKGGPTSAAQSELAKSRQ